MTYNLSQIFGGLVFLFIFASMQTKDIKRVLLCQIGCNGFGMLSYVLIGGFSGCGIYLIATVQSVIFFWLRIKDREVSRWLNPVILVAYVGCSAVMFSGWIDVFPMVAAVLCAFGIAQKNATNYRFIMLMNSSVWIVYDLFMGAYTMLASHIFTVASALLGIIRLDLLPKFKK